MRLVIHAGLHKTGSTYFQHLLHVNRDALRTSPVYCEPDPKMPANHATAWTLLLGNGARLRFHLAEAKKAGKRTVLMTSEDFEGIIFEPQRAVMAEEIARSFGFDQVEWHFVIRQPGEYLQSVFAEMTRHGFVDFTDMFVHGMRDGFATVHRPDGVYPTQWRFCFDVATHIRAFVAKISGTVILHDFADADPFPGYGIARELSILDLLTAPPGDEARNPRATADEITRNLRLAVRSALDGTALATNDEVIDLLAGHANLPAEVLAQCAQTMQVKFGPANAALVSAHRLPSPIQSMLAGGTKS